MGESFSREFVVEQKAFKPQNSCLVSSSHGCSTLLECRILSHIFLKGVEYTYSCVRQALYPLLFVRECLKPLIRIF